MNMFWISSILLFALIGCTYGRIVSFNVIAFCQDVSVTFLGERHPMKLINDFSHVYSFSAVCPEEKFNYLYTVDGKSEGFDRWLDVG